MIEKDSKTVTRRLKKHSARTASIAKLAERLGIELDQAETLSNDVLPILKREVALRSHRRSGKAPSSAQVVEEVFSHKLPGVFSMHAVSHLRNNPRVLYYLLKSLSRGIPAPAAGRLVESHTRQYIHTLETDLAKDLGIHQSYLDRFQHRVMVTIRKATQNLYQKKRQQQALMEPPEAFIAFVIENIFIDEFENNLFIRTFADSHNRAILLPEARKIAVELIRAWMTALPVE